MNVKGQAALVTGGGSGLGEAVARALAAAGAKVTVLDVNLDGAKRVAGEIGGHAIKCDVSDGAAAEAAIAEAKARHGVPRVLMNCAGIGPAARIVGKEGPMPLADFARCINVNLIGTFNMMRLAAAEMTKADALDDNERGVIISTASVAAYEGQIGQAAYSASKGGVVALTLPAAREFARFGVRVNAVAPGIFFTPLLHGLPKPAQESLAAQIPYPSRLGRPEEFANLVMHIVDNVMINGEVIRIDGAIRMAPK
jgi:NAD(P)-dependent dehydrogenase (short-subunit alcohol dehydrogenase family)